MITTFFIWDELLEKVNLNRTEKIKGEYDTLKPEQIEAVEKLVCSNVKFEYFEEEVYDDVHLENPYTLRTTYAAVCEPQKWADSIFRTNLYLSTGANPKNLSGNLHNVTRSRTEKQ